jgi:2',3'-cyclic-nucleotide 2'-phosphodiesterase/3'-nucleotidase
MKRIYIVLLSVLICASAFCRPKSGDYTFQLLTTNDVHGHFFDSTYVSSKLNRSLFAVNHYVDSIRRAAGPQNVILVDAGDILQGDNVSYYYNYVDTVSPHVYPRMAAYMKYDAIAEGNHDVETGHSVYDRVAKDLNRAGIPFLAGNSFRTDNGKPYFPKYTIIKRQGIKIAILGYTNPNIKEWLSENIWRGIEFKSLIPLVQQDVDEVIAKEKPQVVIVAVHSGTGRGKGDELEDQGLDLFQSLKGVDFLVCAHDHSPFVKEGESMCLINSGSHCRFIGHGTLHLSVRKGKVVSKSVSADLIPVKADLVDTQMRKAFYPDYLAVKAFTLQKVGQLNVNLWTRDAFKGMCDYMNLLHTVCLSCAPAQISIAAPLTANGFVKKGTLVYNDLFTIYPYENQLFVIKMTGKEIKDYLEYSYDGWIQTASSPEDHVLRIQNRNDQKLTSQKWTFVNRSYNFDSAAGINYTVDVTKPYGSRVDITTLAGGEPFRMDKTYFVSMTSYRASGGGGLLSEGAGVDTGHIEDRVVEKYPEIRNILYNYMLSNPVVDPALIGDPQVIGSWRFVPASVAEPALERDMILMYGR